MTPPPHRIDVRHHPIPTVYANALARLGLFPALATRLDQRSVP